MASPLRVRGSPTSCTRARRAPRQAAVLGGGRRAERAPCNNRCIASSYPNLDKSFSEQRQQFGNKFLIKPADYYRPLHNPTTLTIVSRQQSNQRAFGAIFELPSLRLRNYHFICRL